MTVTVAPGPVEGTVAAPPSKSITHRALFATLLAGGGSVRRPLWSEDTKATLDAIRAFGAQVVATEAEAVVRGNPLQPAEVDCRNSGTTLRIATAIAALADGTTALTGDASLLERPIGPLADALAQLGATTTTRADGRPPVEVEGPATGGHAKMPGDVSSQFVSALLLAGPRFPDGLTLELTTPLTSAPYVDLTIATLERHGITVERDGARFSVDPGAYQRASMRVPGDYSGASFPLVAGALAEGPVTVTGLPEGTGQGDEAIAELLSAFDVEVERQADTLTVDGASPTGAELDLGDNPDLFPPLAALAAATEGTTELTGAPHLRHKESDRIAAMVDGLTALGVDAQALDDGARIEGGPIQGGRVDSLGDHRIQMAFAVLALAAEDPIEIEGPDDAHAVSYPGFLGSLAELGADVTIDGKEPAEVVR